MLWLNNRQQSFKAKQSCIAFNIFCVTTTLHSTDRNLVLPATVDDAISLSEHYYGVIKLRAGTSSHKTSKSTIQS